MAIGAAILALTIGLVLGSLAGYFGGIVDGTVSRFTDLVMAFPMLLFLVLIGSTVQRRALDVDASAACSTRA